MSAQDGQKGSSPLESAGGTTTIKDAVVSRIIGIAVGEVDGVRLGGTTARRADGFLEKARVSPGGTPGVSVQVGKTEVAVDLSVGVRYGMDLVELLGRVREKVVNRIENLVGLSVKEVNVTVTDIVFTDREGGGDGTEPETGYVMSRSGPADEGPGEDEPDVVPSGPPGTREGGVKRVEPRSRTHAEAESGPVPEEEVRVSDTPLGTDETAEYDVVEDDVAKKPGGHRDERKNEPRDGHESGRRG